MYLGFKIFTENVNPKDLKVGDVILTKDKCIVVTKIDKNVIEVLVPKY